MQKPILLIGGGLAGSLLAVLLARKGYRVRMYEHRQDMRSKGYVGGRSINLALSVRGIAALREVGLLDDIMQIAIPMPGRMLHSRESALTYQPYSANPENCIYSVSRGELNVRLLQLASNFPEIELIFDTRCTNFNAETGEAEFKNLVTGETFTDSGETVIATDGAFSAVRYAMQKLPRFSFSQSYLDTAYKELAIPPDAAGAMTMEKNALHIWPRGSFMMIALPNTDGTFTCTLFMPYEEAENSFAQLQTPDQVQAFFEQHFPDALPLMPTLIEDFFQNPTSHLATMRCNPWVYRDKVALLGDAAHAVVPFFGQGMNCSFEDCVVLGELIDAHRGDWTTIFAQYQAARIDNANAIADMAIENQIEMRVSTADPRFLLRKKVEHKLQTAFPEHFISRYDMVSFSQIPYAEAVRRGKINDKILEELMEGIGHEDQIDMILARNLVHERLG